MPKAKTALVEITTIEIGDQFISSHGPTIELMREPETYQDRFGIERLRLWCKRIDTGEEGWVFYGYGAMVRQR